MCDSKDFSVFDDSLNTLMNQPVNSICVTAAARGTEFSGEVTASTPLATCYSLAVWGYLCRV